MSHNRKLGKPTDQRIAMLRAMTTYLLENGQIKTTITRAKEVAPLAEKMITLAKQNDLAAYRQALGFITKEDVAKKLFQELGPKYAERNGGYTRIMKLGNRKGDNAPIVIMELVTEPCTPKAKKAAPAASTAASAPAASAPAASAPAAQTKKE